MPLWTLLSCPAPGGGKPIDRFIASLGAEAENDLFAVLGHLEVLERKFWMRPAFDGITKGKKYRDMGEVRFSGENKTYRLFGFFGPGRYQFTFLAGYEKKRDLKHEIDLAEGRKAFAKNHEELLYAFTF
jgi:hypothetical protein